MTMFKSLLATSFLAIAATTTVAFEAKAQDRSLWMYDGQRQTVTGYFLAGESIYGVCDRDCYDLDLFLYSSSGTLVSSDTLVDAFPIVTAPRDGTYTVEVTMPNCSHSAGCAVEISSDYGF